MSSPQSDSFLAGVLARRRATVPVRDQHRPRDARHLGRRRLIVGILITFWPKNSAIALTIILGIYFVIAGIAYLGLGIFSRGHLGRRESARHHPRHPVRLRRHRGALEPVGVDRRARHLPRHLHRRAVDHRGVVALVQSGDSGSRGWAIFFGLLSIVAGLILVFSPAYVVALWWILGISLIVLGLIQIVRAFTFGKGVTPAA